VATCQWYGQHEISQREIMMYYALVARPFKVDEIPERLPNPDPPGKQRGAHEQKRTKKSCHSR
jgi:hypothetical protein